MKTTKVLTFPVMFGTELDSFSIEPHSIHGIFAVHSKLEETVEGIVVSKKSFTISHIHTGRSVIQGIPWISVASKLAKHFNTLMMRGIIKREAKSKDPEVVLSAFSGDVVAVMQEAHAILARAKSSKEAMSDIDDLFAARFTDGVDSPGKQINLIQ